MAIRTSTQLQQLFQKSKMEHQRKKEKHQQMQKEFFQQKAKLQRIQQKEANALEIKRLQEKYHNQLIETMK